MKGIFILSGARTPFAAWARGRRGDGGRGGALAGLDPFDLGAAAIRGALERARLPPERVDRLVFANMYQDGPHGCYGARYAGLRAGLPATVPMLTVAMACGSGLNALIEAAQDLGDGSARTVAAGGADCVSRLPKEIFVPSFRDLACASQIGETVERLAARRGIGREAMDRWALESHRRAREAREAGRLGEEISPAGGLSADDAIAPPQAQERLVRARSSHGEGGAISAANTHAIVDGGSALLLCAEDALPAGAEPLGRFVAGAYAGVPPEEMGLASVPAIRAALARAGWEPGSVDRYEINETFAAQMLLDLGELGVDAERVNVNGGAIAFGHPFAGTGCRLALGLLLELRRRKLRRGVASICVGGGLGVAAALEAA